VKYISRFPAEPDHFHRAYHGTPYDLMHCGHPTYHAHPVYCVAPYIGFGVHPHTFDPYHNHLWGYDDLQDLHAKMMYKEEDYKKQYEACEFMAPVSSSEQQGKVYVDFPAECQLATGEYKLVIIAKIHQPGYAPDNLRTITMDYNTVFKIVGSSDEADLDGSVVISVGNMKKPDYITVKGDFMLVLGTPGTLTATVYPQDIDVNTVTWSIPNEEDAEYITLYNRDNNTVTMFANKLDDGEDYRIVTVRATSVKDPSVYKDVQVRISKEASIDIYTEAGKLTSEGTGRDQKDYITLHLTDGRPVNIETTKETVWYEG